jgi:hypothetical protein
VSHTVSDTFDGSNGVGSITRWPPWFPRSILPTLQQLTRLELSGYAMKDPDGLQHLQGLTLLQELWLDSYAAPIVEAGMLSGFQRLTLLQLNGAGDAVLEPAALAGHTKLQSLGVTVYSIAGGSAGVALLLSHLQDLQQLTYLGLKGSYSNSADVAPAAAYSVLTASSKLQELRIDSYGMPAGVWQYVFPADRQLPDLQELSFCSITHPAAPEGSLPTVPAPDPQASVIGSCFPSLQRLSILAVQDNAELLAALSVTALTSLSELTVEFC